MLIGLTVCHDCLDIAERHESCSSTPTFCCVACSSSDRALLKALPWGKSRAWFSAGKSSFAVSKNLQRRSVTGVTLDI